MSCDYSDVISCASSVLSVKTGRVGRGLRPRSQSQVALVIPRHVSDAVFSLNSPSVCVFHDTDIFEACESGIL